MCILQLCAELAGKRPHHKLDIEVHHLYLHVCVQQYLKPPDKMLDLNCI